MLIDMLLKKISEHCEKTNTSYEVNDEERDLCRSLVEQELCFYSMDYDHVRTY